MTVDIYVSVYGKAGGPQPHSRAHFDRLRILTWRQKTSLGRGKSTPSSPQHPPDTRRFELPFIFHSTDPPLTLTHFQLTHDPPSAPSIMISALAPDRDSAFVDEEVRHSRSQKAGHRCPPFNSLSFRKMSPWCTKVGPPTMNI